VSWSQKTLDDMTARLKKGEVIAAPAEGVYGLCADPFNTDALQNLLAIKERNPGKGFVVLIEKPGHLSMLTETLAKYHWAAIDKYWPGPITLLLPARPEVPSLLTGGGDKIAVRLPAAAHVQAYLKAWGGPLVSTSANLSGEKPAQIIAELPDDTLFALESPIALDGSVSRILDVESGHWIR
jgi:L-threonylcarbamoyladenylate synthase